MTVNSSGTQLVETRYKPWGEVRYVTPSSTLQTRYTFTGQYSYVSDEATDLGNNGFGLMFYNARWYDPALGRFAQADSIVPAGVQGYDRYAYTNNNPVLYTDPSGHGVDCGIGTGCVSPYHPPSGEGGNDDEPTYGNGLIGPPVPPTYGPPTPTGLYIPDSGLIDVPSHVTLHPLDGNVVSRIPIYDYSYIPPRVIGYRITSYAYDDWHGDVGGFLFPDFSDPVSSTQFAYNVAGEFLEPAVANLSTLGIAVVCELCGIVIGAGFQIYNANENISFDAHLRTHDVYFSEPSWPRLETPLDQPEGIRRVP